MTINKQRKRGITIEEKYIGSEPTFTTPVTTMKDTRLVRALNWYNYSFDPATARKWIAEYMKKDAELKGEVEAFSRVADWRISITLCSIARMLNNGTKLPKQAEQVLRNGIATLIELTEKRRVKADPDKVVVSIRERLEEKAAELAGPIEEAVDEIVTTGKVPPFSAYDYFTRIQTNSKVSSILASRYRAVKAEIDEARTGDDIELREAYTEVGPKGLKALSLFLNAVVTDCERFGKNQRVMKPRKQRKKKERPASKVVEKVQYKKNDTEYKLASISPTDIVGAQTLFTFNVKKRTLAVYHAEGPKGLSMRGTTITGFDPARSIGKKLRKPAPVLEKVLSGGKVVLRHVLSEVKATEVNMSGRLNNETVLLRALK